MIDFIIPRLENFADVETAIKKFLAAPHAIPGPDGPETVHQRWMRLERFVSLPHARHMATRHSLEEAICLHTDAFCFANIDLLPTLKNFERQALRLAFMSQGVVEIKAFEAKRSAAKEMIDRHSRWVEMAEGLVESARVGLGSMQSLNANAREKPSK